MDNTKQVEIRLNELAKRASYTGAAQYSRFLEPSCFPAAKTAAYESGVQCVLSGGYPDAERCMAGYAFSEEEYPNPLTMQRLVWRLI